MIEDIVREVEVGGIYYGEVVRIMNFGAFVDLGCGGKEGLLHISKISKEPASCARRVTCFPLLRAMPPFISPTNGRKFWTKIFLKPLNGPEARTGKRQENSGKPFWKKAMLSRPCGSSWISWEESRAWMPCSARGGWHPEIKEPQTAAASSARHRGKPHIIHLFN